MSNISSLIEVFRMTELSREARERIIIKLGRAINNDMGMNITEEIVVELVAELNPDSEILKDEHYKKYTTPTKTGANNE